MSSPIFFTSICANYLAKALALAESIKRTHPGSRFIIGLVEQKLPAGLNPAKYPAVDDFVLAHELMPAHEFDGWVFRYSIVEAATAIKGILLRHLYTRFHAAQHFVYLDPDTYVYSPLTELFAQLSVAPIVITPHLEVPGNLEMELSALRHGVFNLGFLAVARHEDTESFINWWVDRLNYACYDDIPNGIFTDQKWIDLVPCFFPCSVLREPGYNFATWSLLDRHLTRDASGNYLVNGTPLRFAHFSGFDGGTFHRCVERWAANNSTLLLEFAEEYDLRCREHGAAAFRSIPWSYSRYQSGSKVWRFARLAWRECYKPGSADNPFKSRNVALCLKMLRGKRLIRFARKVLTNRV